MFNKITSTICCVILIFASHSLQGRPREFLIFDPIGSLDNPNSWHGFFASFQSLIGGLNFYEKQQYAGCRVEFTWGLYLNPKLGPNWWEYYFEPINIGSEENAFLIRFDSTQKYYWAYDAISTISRERASELIQRYIHVKPVIQKKIDSFVQENFGNYFIIGVHYRGTDKSSEAPRVSYSSVYKAILRVITTVSSERDYKLFIASDEQDFINYMKRNFGERICCLDAIRSSDGYPIHFNQTDPYRQGEESIMDCILLSKTNFLVRTQSNVSASAANFNPDLEVISLNSHNASIWLPNVRM